MAIKTIEYKVNIAGITPATEQFGGTQGDHRVTVLNFILNSEFHQEIDELGAEGNKVMYRFDVYDGEGGVWSSDIAELKNTVSLELEERHTRHGGKIIVYLVITALSADNETQVELYSFPAVIRLKNRPVGMYQDGENYESVTSLAEVAKSNALDAEKTNKELQAFAAQIEEKLKNGDFDGVGVESAVIINDELIITYTDGAVQNLGNVKGNTGPQGEKGDAGKDAVTDQIYLPESENAQSGIAVASAINNKIEIYTGTEITVPPGTVLFSSIPAFEEVFLKAKVGDLYFNTEKTEIYQCVQKYDEANKKSSVWQGLGYFSDVSYNSNSLNAQSGKAVAEAVGGCVEKIKGNGLHYQVYGVTDNPNADTTVMFKLDTGNDINGEIPRRIGGILKTDTPYYPNDCANKKYVDDLIGDIETALDELHNYAQAIIGGAK